MTQIGQRFHPFARGNEKGRKNNEHGDAREERREKREGRRGESTNGGKIVYLFPLPIFFSGFTPFHHSLGEIDEARSKEESEREREKSKVSVCFT